MLNNKPLFGAALDLSEAFDNVPQDITLDILRRMGIHWRVLTPLQYMYKNLRRYFKIRGYLGHPLTATNGDNAGVPALGPAPECVSGCPLASALRCFARPGEPELCRRHNLAHQQVLAY